MTRLACRSIIWLPILIVGLFGAGSAAAQTSTQQREAAVLKARAGSMAEAQAALRAMLAAGTDDGLVAMDLDHAPATGRQVQRGGSGLREGGASRPAGLCPARRDAGLSRPAALRRGGRLARRACSASPMILCGR